MCSFALRNPADGYLVVSQENGGCDASRGFRYYIRAWPALPITTGNSSHQGTGFSLLKYRWCYESVQKYGTKLE